MRRWKASEVAAGRRMKGGRKRKGESRRGQRKGLARKGLQYAMEESYHLRAAIRLLTFVRVECVVRDGVLDLFVQGNPAMRELKEKGDEK